MIMFSHTVRLSANYGDAGPRLQYSHVNSTLGIARLCYSHFRLQVWDGKGRASGGRRRGKVFSLGTIGEREIRAVGLLSSPCILQDSVYINIYVIIFCLLPPMTINKVWPFTSFNQMFRFKNKPETHYYVRRQHMIPSLFSLFNSIQIHFDYNFPLSVKMKMKICWMSIIYLMV